MAKEKSKKKDKMKGKAKGKTSSIGTLTKKELLCVASVWAALALGKWRLHIPLAFIRLLRFAAAV